MQNKELKNKKLNKGSGDVRYNILIKSNLGLFNLGKVIIRRFKGEIFYVLPHKYLIDDNGRNLGVIDKISWHASGEVHIKTKNGKYVYKQKIQKIKDIGFQYLLRVIIPNFLKLPKKQKKENFDIILNINNYKGQLEFVFSIVSGKLIAADFYKKPVPVKREPIGDDILVVEKRGLGYESDNADKLLQFSLRKYNKYVNFSTPRIILPPDLKINRSIDF